MDATLGMEGTTKILFPSCTLASKCIGAALQHHTHILHEGLGMLLEYEMICEQKVDDDGDDNAKG